MLVYAKLHPLGDMLVTTLVDTFINTICRIQFWTMKPYFETDISYFD